MPCMVPYPAFTFCGICSLSYRYLASSLPVVSYTLFDTFYLTNFHSPTPAFFFYISLLFYFLLAPLLNCTSTASPGGTKGVAPWGQEERGRGFLRTTNPSPNSIPNREGLFSARGRKRCKWRKKKETFFDFLPFLSQGFFLVGGDVKGNGERGFGRCFTSWLNS